MQRTQILVRDTSAPVAQPDPTITSARGWSQADVTFRPSRSSFYVTMMTME
jgi:hypothetical protein